MVGDQSTYNSSREECTRCYGLGSRDIKNCPLCWLSLSTPVFRCKPVCSRKGNVQRRPYQFHLAVSFENGVLQNCFQQTFEQIMLLYSVTSSDVHKCGFDKAEIQTAGTTRVENCKNLRQKARLVEFTFQFDCR